MSKMRTIHSSFVSGELSEAVFGRTDKEFYASGADKLRNVYVDPLGGVYKREGMRFIDSTQNGGKVKLIEFAFNTEQTYLLVLSDKRMKVYKDDVLVANITSTILDNVTESILSEIKYTQSADTLILVHAAFLPIKITRTSDTVWVVTNVVFNYVPTNPFNGVTVTEPNAHLTFSALIGEGITLTVTNSVFVAGHVKQKIVGKTGGVLSITQFINASSVKADVIVEFPGDVGPSDTQALIYDPGDWQLETGYEDVWSVTRGYPKSCAFYQGRLWLGGSNGRPSTLWGSKSGEFFNFNTAGGQADDAIDVTIDDDRVNGILNIFPGRNLQIFTTGGEFYIPQTETDPIKPENILLQKSTSYGSSKVKPISVDGSTIFIEGSGRVVREFVFNDLERSYNASSLSLLASHLIQTPVSLAVRPSGTVNPISYVYVVNSDGTIAVLSILRSEKLFAWSLFSTQGVVEDLVNVIDKVYLVVKRTIGGVQKRFIEKLDPEYYLDASIVVTNPTPIVNYTGLSVLANQAVKVRSSSFVLADNLISNAGNITIELDYKTIEVGLGFEVLIRLLPIDINLGYKTLTGDWRRIVYALIRTTKSRSFEVHCGKNIFKPVFRNLGSNLLDKPIEPNNGWKKVFLSGGISRDASVDIIQNEPVDFDLIAIVIAVTI